MFSEIIPEPKFIDLQSDEGYKIVKKQGNIGIVTGYPK